MEYTYTKKTIHFLSEIPTLLGVLYFYVLNLASLPREAGTVVVLLIAVTPALELLLTLRMLSVNIYGINDCSTRS